MRLVAVSIVVAAGALLLVVAEVARSFTDRSHAGEWAVAGGIVLTALGLIGLLVELHPPEWLRDQSGPRRKAGRDE